MGRKTRFVAIGTLALILGIWGCGKKAIEGEKVFSEDFLRAQIEFLADDLLGGRAPGSLGSTIAQKYIQSQMRMVGLQPAFEGNSYLQPFDVVEIDINPKMSLQFTRGVNRLNLKYYDDFVGYPGVQKPVVRVQNAELVFVGYGIQAPEFDWDDFKDVDVKGKVLLIMNNDPDTGDPEFFGGKARLYYGRWDYKYEQAAKMGALGAIIIHTTPSAGYPWQVVQTSWSGKQFELPQTTDSPLVYKGWITEDVAYKLCEMAGKDLDQLRTEAEKKSFKPIPLGVNVNAMVKAQYRLLPAANVGGLLPGNDPELKNQVVVFSAHYDHLGIGTPVEGDSIYNGALDNASGVASILMLAKAFVESEQPPRRSLLFLAVDGEESGLLGSQFYAQNPTFPAGKIAANVNLDGANIWGPTKDIALIGYGKSTIDEIVKEEAAKLGRTVIPDPHPEYGSFYRSDQFNFAKIGVPAFYPDMGKEMIGKPAGYADKVTEEWLQKHYHQPSDEYLEDWNLQGQIEDLKLFFLISQRLANDPEMPKWNPGDEFEAVRLKALENK